MILADKITELRKKEGWSQEQLAEKVDVSRQAISKWEGAQTTPDIGRILQMAQLFGVSTDYLLKDTLERPEEAPDPDEKAADEAASGLTPVSMEQAHAYLDFRRQAAHRVAPGVMLCVLSSIPLILLAAAQEAGMIPLKEEQAVSLGVIILLLAVAAAVVLFVSNGIREQPYQFIEKHDLDTAYGVDGMVREERSKEEPQYIRKLITGIALFVLAAIPVLMSGLFLKDRAFLPAVGVSVTLLMVSVGVELVVSASVIRGGYDALLEEGDFSRQAKKRDRDIGGPYWSIAVALYLLLSFLTGRWDMTWIVWPVAGVLYGVIGSFL
ncbi:MAG: helix-turn-helix domain-containing protein [Clostridiales bacterium]|nr:helix-turn-helix domain-containing protein [Clostridiales bacterium]